MARTTCNACGGVSYTAAPLENLPCPHCNAPSRPQLHLIAGGSGAERCEADDHFISGRPFGYILMTALLALIAAEVIAQTGKLMGWWQ